MQVKAILFDTRSIQKYIFSGNKLKTNIGASYIVDRLFQDILVEKTLAGIDAKFDGKPAYIGGGNALILFDDKITEAELKKVVGDFTARVLVEAPGLRTGAAIGSLTIDEGDDVFQTSLNALYKSLKLNQNTCTPVVNIPYTGLTVPCSYNGEVAQIWDSRHLAGSEARFVSAEVIAKLAKSEAANDALQKKFAAELVDGDMQFAFPKELEKLGQIETENYYAIVHIDGNNMGVRFRNCKNLQERKDMSQDIAEKCCKSFKKLLKSITAEYSTYQQSKAFAFKETDAVHYLPIRPLILGGDDVTFVCMGRMAVEYAKRYIESMADKSISDASMSVKEINCCGGIAILSTAYPFFRGYELAEQLCGAAKQKSRAKDSSWLDFAILHGEQAPELEQIRQREYSGELGNMHFGPYKINAADYRFGIEKLFEGVKAMRKLPRNKVKELRSVLARDEHEIATFLEQLEKQGQSVPHIAGLEDYEAKLWYRIGKLENKTPYLDMIEMMDFMYDDTDSKEAK